MRLPRALLVLGAASLAALAAACGTILGFEQGTLRPDGGPEAAAADGPSTVMDATGPDREGPADAGIDAVEAGSDVSDGSPEAAVGCDAALCGSTCMADCTMCNQQHVPCYACDGGGAPVETCSSTTGLCQGGNYAHCMCGQPSDCPGDNQVCSSNDCMSCGEPGTDQHTCKQGGMCTEISGQCF